MGVCYRQPVAVVRRGEGAAPLQLAEAIANDEIAEPFFDLVEKGGIPKGLRDLLRLVDRVRPDFDDVRHNTVNDRRLAHDRRSESVLVYIDP